MSAFTAQPGWKAIIATPDKTNLTGFKVLSYPVIGWRIDHSGTAPITPVFALENGFFATIAPDGGVFSRCSPRKKYPSVDAWLEDIKTVHGLNL